MQRSVFDLTHERKLSMDMGKLVPIMVEEIIPGDEFAVKTDMLVRVAPMLAPMMHRVNVYTHYFFVPTRTLWTDWEDFITGGVLGDNASVIPTIKAPITTGYTLSSLGDHLKLPVGISEFEALAFPFRAYAKIVNDWFINLNLVTPLVMSKASGVDTTTSTVLATRMWEKDYFTSALPEAQRGDPVEIPLGGSVPVDLVPFGTDNSPMIVRTASNDAISGGTIGLEQTVTSGNFRGDDGVPKVLDPNGRLVADLGSASPITVSAFRQVATLQQWAEKSARGGSRYVEHILEFFGVRSSDARLQRAEYLGGGVSPITISEVLQTAPAAGGSTPLGAMAGHGFSTPGLHGFKKKFEEHGYLIGIMSVLPRTAYQEGCPRMYNRRSRFDFPYPTFAGLGEQGILKKELYAASADPEGIFGYAPRYEELRQRESTVHGDFKDTLDYWHMGRIFDAVEPTLSSTFVTADPTKRILAAPSSAALWVQVLNQVQAKRPLPLVARPGIDRI